MPQSVNEPVEIFLVIMGVILLTPMLSERIHLPGIVGIILGGMLVGPHLLGLLPVGPEIELLSTIGLVYLMFSAGLEVDVQQFNRVRKKSLLFGLLTYLVPQGLGILLGLQLGLNWLGAILLGSAFSSHTLIAFPILTRLGVVRNEAVSVTVGATVFTDIGAFIVLAVVLGAHGGNLSIQHIVLLFLLLSVLAILILAGLPRLGKFFFRHFSGRAVEFQFILVVLFVSALAAERIGVHAVVGAFLAGLAINATLPHRSPVIGHVLFLGESFFIPVFLLYSGMITDPLAFVENRATITAALGITAVAYTSKLAAAWATGRIFGYSRAEFLTAYGLSHAQAAVTIPTLLIGLQTGLFSMTLFNAAILMILLTSITSPLMVQRFAPRLTNGRLPAAPQPLFQRILVPVANPETQEPLLTLAGVLAQENDGELLTLNVAQQVHGQILGLEHQRDLLDRVAGIIGDPEAQVQTIPRVDPSIARGILNAAIENQATTLILGWRGKPTFKSQILGDVLDQVVWNAPIPVLIARLTAPVNAVRRVTLVIPPGATFAASTPCTLTSALRLHEALNAPLVVLAPEERREILASNPDLQGEARGYTFIPLMKDVLAQIVGLVSSSDLVVLPVTTDRRQFRRGLGNLPERLAEKTRASILVVHDR